MGKKDQDRQALRDEAKKQLYKEAVKEGLKEWLSERERYYYEKAGRWSIHALTAAFAVAVVYFILMMNGWQQK